MSEWSDPTWDLSEMFGLHNVAHSFPFVKLPVAVYMRTVYWQNGEQNGPYLRLSVRLSWSTRQLAWQ